MEQLGPGLITGAADDDPSGISTYSIAGATFGYSTLWIALVSLPMMAAVQLMCARLGAVTGRGLTHEIRLHYPSAVLWGACGLLAVANVTNLAADLGGMAEVTHMITGVSAVLLTPAYAALIVGLLVWSNYRTITRTFKWLTLSLFAYVFASFFAHPDLAKVIGATVAPHLSLTRPYFSVLVAVLGTTISPYLFFWQAAQEVEERRAAVKASPPAKRFMRGWLARLRTDVMVGMCYSNLIMYFIILTTAATLHANGQTDINTAKEAAEALLPLAGRGAYLLFAFGIIGTGMLGVPVLAGSCAYAFAEAAAWRGALDTKPRRAPQFYAVIAAATGAGVVLNFAHVSAMRMMFLSAEVNGVLAPPLILLVVLLTSNRRVMGAAVNSSWLRVLGWLTFACMAAASAGLLIA